VVTGQPHALATLPLVATQNESVWPPGQSGHFGEEKNMLLLPELKFLTIQPIAYILKQLPNVLDQALRIHINVLFGYWCQ
jgi:hypothetical protein